MAKHDGSARVCSSNSTVASGASSTHCSTATSRSQLSSYRRLQPLSDTAETGTGNTLCCRSSQFSAAASRNTPSASRSTSVSWQEQTKVRHNSAYGESSFSSRFNFYRFTTLGPCGLRRAYVHRRFPCNKKIWLVYMMFFLQGTAEFSTLLLLFFGLDAYTFFNPPQTVAVYLLLRCIVFMAYPVMGFLADTFFGRYRVLKTCLYMSLLGAVILAVGFSTSQLDPWLKHDEVNHYERFDFSGEEQWSTRTVIFIGVLYAMMWIGFTGVQVNLIPFGVDQLVEPSSGELSSYFHWYFWCFNAGSLVGAATVPYIYQYYSLGLVFLLLAVCFTGEILILILRRDNGFVIHSHIGNPFKLVYQVLQSSFRVKKPRFRSAFDVGHPPPSRIDLAMQINGGRFTVEQVEDVKTFLRILVILLSFFGYFAVSSQLLTTYLLEGIRMTVPHGSFDDCTTLLRSNTHFFDNITQHMECHMWNVPPSLWIVLTNFVPILFLIPLVDRILYVSFRPKMLKRIAVGKFFLLLSILVAIVVEIVRLHELWEHFERESSIIVINAIPFHTKSATTFHTASPLSILWITPQYLLFAFAEIFASVSAVEFIYAQSPGAMKGLLLGMLFLTNGLAMGVASLIIYLQSLAEQFHFLSFFGNSNHHIKDILNCLLLKKDHTRTCVDSPLFSYLLLTVVVLLSVAVFARAAIKYTLRKRDVEPYNPNF